MHLPRFQLHSLKTRITLLTLLIVVVSFLLLAFYTKGLLREELMRFSGDQQRSALSLLTAEVNHGLQDRLTGLATVAAQLTPQALADPPSLRVLLADQQFLLRLFNGGLMVWGQAGALLIDGSFLAGKAVPQALDPQALGRVLKQGESVIGSVQLHDQRAGVFAMAVPIRNPQGLIIGVLAGVIRLDQPNFLSQLTSHSYGQTGNFFLIEPRQRLIFATSDKARLMELLPPPGVNAWIDRFVQGFEGTTQTINPHGVEVLVSIEQIPLAHWYASVTLSSDETTSLIQTIAPGARLVGLGLALLCVTLIWLMLRHQFAPMTAAAKTLDGFVRQNQAPQALHVVRHDEIGQLVGGFNRLLETLTQQQQVLQQSELFKQAVLNSVTAEIAVLDHTGVILAVNDAWRRYAPQRAPNQQPAADVGSNYLAYGQNLGTGTAAAEAVSASDGMRAVLAGDVPHFHLECACHVQPQRWCSVSVTPLEGAGMRGAVVSIEDITERIEVQNQISKLAFYDPLTQLPNRRLVLDRLAQEMVRSRRAQTRLALLFIDLDKFKPINDELGHAVGDWLLQAVAQRVQSCLRESDTAARIGGDEFVVLLPDMQDKDAALALAEKIRQALAQVFVTDQGIVLNISSSIGVALYPDHAACEKDLLRVGDEAMYQAKKSGRNAVVLCAPMLPEPADAGLQSYVHLRWKAAFASGNPLVDQEHEVLFGLTNALLDRAVLRHTQPDAFEAAFALLLAHVEAHFAQEEALLQARGFAGLAAHAQEHRDLVARARALHQSLQGSDEGGVAEIALIRFLVADLAAGHLLHADRAYFAFLASPVEASAD